MSTFTRAGAVMRTATTAVRITALNGTLAWFSLRQWRWPGTAPSRLNANSIRVQLVMQATVQKNWPTVEMVSTVVAQLVLRAWVKIVTTPPPALVTPSTSCTAKRKARSRIQPPIAE